MIKMDYVTHYGTGAGALVISIILFISNVFNFTEAMFAFVFGWAIGLLLIRACEEWFLWA